MFTEPDTISHCLFAYVICIFFLLYYPTLSLLCMFQSYNDNLFCGWTSSCFFIGQNIIIVSFASRNKAALRTLMKSIWQFILRYIYIFFLARFARFVFKTLINNKMYRTIRHRHKSIHHIVY